MSENWLAKEMEAENKKRMNPMIKRAYIVLTVILLGAISVLGITLASKPQRVASASQNTPIVTGSSPSSSTSPTVSVPAVSSDTSALSQEEAEDKAMAAEDEAAAKDDVSSAQSLSQPISVPSFSISTANGTVSVPSYSYTPPPNPGSTCAYSSQIASSSQSLAQAENKLSADEQASQTGAMPDGESSFGVSASEHAGAWASAIQADENTVNSAQGTLSSYESQPGC